MTTPNNTESVRNRLIPWQNFTPDELACKLARENYKGYPGRTNDCPIARLLKNLCGNEDVLVGHYYMTWMERGYQCRMFTPPNIHLFIRAFDHGEYPELVDTGNKP